MSTRREMGSLEREVLMCLWASEDPMSPADVRLALGDGLAYTTVMTVLSRLWRKGMVERLAMGRGFVYRPVLSKRSSLPSGCTRTCDGRLTRRVRWRSS